ncbi:MAG: regulatory protein RecX [Thermoleophilaceae bacterium]|nr:regulatory protein RecX [Thermoleophilaceae bacterium]
MSGDPISLDGAAQTPARSEYERAVELAYRAVSARDRTIAELRSCLQRKRVEPEAIEHAVGELEAAGYLDDARFAQRFAEDKRALERWGSERIARDLRRRGVAPELAEAALSAQAREQELDAAIGLLAERVPVPPTGARERDRAWRMLVRKGYEPELAYEAVRAHGRRAAA